jgi:hypothetical protein
MYEGGIPENLISEKSGHKSIKALRSYETTSVQQEKVAGSMISGEASISECQGRKIPTAEAHQPNMPTFTGMNNCMFTFYCPTWGDGPANKGWGRVF